MINHVYHQSYTISPPLLPASQVSFHCSSSYCCESRIIFMRLRLHIKKCDAVTALFFWESNTFVNEIMNCFRLCILKKSIYAEHQDCSGAALRYAAVSCSTKMMRLGLQLWFSIKIKILISRKFLKNPMNPHFYNDTIQQFVIYFQK
jgi:hypothetical protein